jgi:hypothetical protein
MILTVAQTIGRVSNGCMILQNELERIDLIKENWTVSKLSLCCIKHHAKKPYRTVEVQHCSLLNPE